MDIVERLNSIDIRNIGKIIGLSDGETDTRRSSSTEGDAEYDRPRVSRISMRHTSTSPYTLNDELTVMCCTANLGNSNPFVDQEGACAWLPKNGNSDDGRAYDIIAIGIQEGDYLVKSDKRVGSQRFSAQTEMSPTVPEPQRNSRSSNGDSTIDIGDENQGDSSSDDDDDDEDDDDEGVEVDKIPAFSFPTLKQAVQPIRKAKGRRHLVASIDNYFKDTHRLIDEVQSNQMRLRVYVLQKHWRGITNIQKANRNTGIAGVYGNKGGQVLCFSIFSVSLCFVSAHLAAHEGAAHLKRRNESYTEICRDSRVGQKYLDLSSQFHHVFWMGDLNYRTSWEDMPGLDGSNKKQRRQSAWDKVYAMVLGEKFDELFFYDELQKQMKEHKAFYGWKTPQPTFPPTFKVQTQVPGYCYQRKRIPSWTDRILYKSLVGFEGNLELNHMSSVPQLQTSDHKPVAATFTISNLKRNIQLRSPIINANENFYAFSLENIKINLSTSSKPDPYVTVLSDPPGLIVDVNAASAKACRVPPASKRQSKKSVATFEKPIVAKVLVGDNGHKQFHLCHAIVCVMDHENLGSNDRLGSASMVLSDLWENCKATGACEVKETLVLDGLPSGEIEFRVVFKQVVMEHTTQNSNCSLM